MDWEKIEVELKKPLDAAAVKPPPAGKFGEYVDGKHVIDEANRIFGHGGWSYTVIRLEICSQQTVEVRGAKQYRVGYLCTVRVDVGGVIREGVAVGSGNGKPDNMADHHESASKEAETDALKRALRSFGNTFGLALYEKDKTKRAVAETLDANMLRILEGNLISAINKAQAAVNLNHILNDQRFTSDLERLRGQYPEAGARVDITIEQRKQDFEQKGPA